jgi:hypothetical protein
MMLGSTAYVSFGTLSSLSTGVVSAEGWVNLRTKTGIRQCLVTSGESTNSGFVLAPVYESDTTRMGFWIRGNDNAWHNVNGSTGFFGDWIHVAATYDKTTLSVYINGQLCGTSTYSGTMLTPTSAGAIGASYDNTTNHLNGWASDVAIYDYVLTASQIKNHYLQGIYPANFYRGGRIYDYFRGVTLGGGEPRWWSNNLVLTNAGADPTFETSAGWSLANGASIANGVLTLTSNGSSAAIATAPLTGLLASTKYSFLIRARHTGTTPTAVLSLDLQGSGYDSGTQEHDVSTGSLTTSFQTYYKSGFDSGSPPATAYIRIFTYSTAPIEIDLVQLTQENYASKSYGALLELYSSNLLSLNQSSVETDLTGISYWSPNGSATLTRDTTKAWVGSASAKITNNYTAAQTCTIDLGSACAGTAGLPYTVSAYLTASVAMTGYVHIRFFNSSGSAIAGTDVASPALSLKPGTWVRGSVSGTAPTGTAYVNIYTHYDTLAVGASGWADGLMIQQRSYATSWMPGGQGSNTETLWFPSRGILNPSQGSIELTAIFNSVSADSSLYQAVFGTGANNPGPRLMIMRNTNGKFAVWDGDGSTESSTDSTLTAVAGTKYYICYTWSSAGRFLYINGSQVATLSRTGNIGFDERSYIGSWNGGNQPNGAISDVRISNKARTLAEHQAHVNAGTPLAPDANTTYLLPLNGQFNSQIVAQEYGANMLSNAMATLTDTTNIGVGNSTIASTTDSGTMFDISNSLKVTASGSGQDSFACPGGDTGAMRLGMVAGGTYTMSAYEYVPSATGLSPNDSRGLKIVGYYCLGGTYYSVQGNRPTATGTLQRVSCTMTIPFGATEAFWRLYLGFSTSGLYTYYTALKLEQKPYPTAFSLGPDNIIPVSALSDLHGWNSTDSSNGWAVQQSNGMWRVGLVSSTSHDNGEILMSKYYPIAPGTTYTESFDFMSDGRPTISSITFYTTTHHAVPVTITEVGNGLFRATASYTAVAGETQLRALDFYVTRNDATYLDINFAQLTDGGGIQSFAVRTTSQIQRIQYGHIISTSSLSATINRTPSNSGDIVTTSLVGDWDGYITFPMTMPFYFNQTLVILQIPVSGSVSVTSTLSGGLSHLSAKRPCGGSAPGRVPPGSAAPGGSRGLFVAGTRPA